MQAGGEGCYLRDAIVGDRSRHRDRGAHPTCHLGRVQDEYSENEVFQALTFSSQGSPLLWDPNLKMKYQQPSLFIQMRRHKFLKDDLVRHQGELGFKRKFFLTLGFFAQAPTSELCEGP